MRDLSPDGGTTADAIVDKVDLARFGWITPRANAWYYANDPYAVTGSAMVLNRLDLHSFPVFVKTSLTITALGLNVTTAGAAGSTVRFGVYADDGSGYPGALVRDTGTQALTATTATGVQSIVLTTALVLTPGLYWIGACAQTAAPSVSNGTASGSSSGFNTYMLNSVTTTLAGATGQVQGYGQTGVTGALPANFITASNPAFIGSSPRILFRT